MEDEIRCLSIYLMLKALENKKGGVSEVREFFRELGEREYRYLSIARALARLSKLGYLEFVEEIPSERGGKFNKKIYRIGEKGKRLISFVEEEIGKEEGEPSVTFREAARLTFRMLYLLSQVEGGKLDLLVARDLFEGTPIKAKPESLVMYALKKGYIEVRGKELHLTEKGEKILSEARKLIGKAIQAQEEAKQHSVCISSQLQ